MSIRECGRPAGTRQTAAPQLQGWGMGVGVCPTSEAGPPFTSAEPFLPRHGSRRDPVRAAPCSGCLLSRRCQYKGQRHPNRTSKGDFPGTGQGREPATGTCFWQKLEGRWTAGVAGSWLLAPGWRLLFVFKHLWFSLVGPKLEGRRRLREAGSYESSPGHSGPALQGLSFGFLGWWLRGWRGPQGDPLGVPTLLPTLIPGSCPARRPS